LLRVIALPLPKAWPEIYNSCDLYTPKHLLPKYVVFIFLTCSKLYSVKTQMLHERKDE